MDKEKLQRYAALKVDIKRLEAEADTLNEEILASMQELNLEEVSFDEGKVSVSYRKKWTYPAEIVTADEQLKAKKKDAERIGTATFENTPSLRFYPVGEDIKE